MNSIKCKQFELMYIIVNCGVASKIIKQAKTQGVTAGTVFLGKGTIRNKLLEFLELNESRKEIVLMAAEQEIARRALAFLSKMFRFDKPNHGIAFSVPITRVLGSEPLECEESIVVKGVENSMYQSIMVIVDRGKAEAVIDAATKVGSKGGTIMHARGSGIHETSTLFAMEIEPEKEVVLIISERTLTEVITSSIREHLQIDQPGNGVIFIQDVSEVYGLH